MGLPAAVDENLNGLVLLAYPIADGTPKAANCIAG
jgi:hypothetical protein